MINFNNFNMMTNKNWFQFRHLILLQIKYNSQFLLLTRGHETWTICIRGNILLLDNMCPSFDEQPTPERFNLFKKNAIKSDKRNTSRWCIYIEIFRKTNSRFTQRCEKHLMQILLVSSFVLLPLDKNIW